jgi:signal transduction histidine kinase
MITAFVDITDRVTAEQQVRSLAVRLTEAEQEERQRISQMLHDDLQQRIFAVKMQLTGWKDIFEKNEISMTEVDFDQMQQLLDESVAITRNLSIDLSPAILKGEGLTEALDWLSGQMHEQCGMTIDIHPNGVSTRFVDSLRILLFQAVREALFNVVKHANTKHAKINFKGLDGIIRLTVNDGGDGFAMSEKKSPGFAKGGLMRFQNRLALLGCKLDIVSKPGKGTQVIIDIPRSQVKE